MTDINPAWVKKAANAYTDAMDVDGYSFTSCISAALAAVADDIRAQEREQIALLAVGPPGQQIIHLSDLNAHAARARAEEARR